jgi:urea carboxylase
MAGSYGPDIAGRVTFDTLLVANRGEIACRIMRAAAALGLRTVAVFSDGDRGAPHVAMADDAVHIGATPARESYLRADRILAAAAATGAGAIHPGYGLLSENAAFATAVQDGGMRFVGPTPQQIELFGAKDRARALARDAAVPIMDGSDVLADADAAVAAAARIGYPVMLKATGGGGGIGMEPCHDEATLREAFERVGRLATASFGAGGIFLERFVALARHVEVQVFGDGRGRVLTIGDRDCTLQRRTRRSSRRRRRPICPRTSASASRARRGRCARPPATAPPAPSSSSTTRSAARRRFSRSTRACRSSTP